MQPAYLLFFRAADGCYNAIKTEVPNLAFFLWLFSVKAVAHHGIDERICFLLLAAAHQSFKLPIHTFIAYETVFIFHCFSLAP